MNEIKSNYDEMAQMSKRLLKKFSDKMSEYFEQALFIYPHL